MILVDTSVWIDHFRAVDEELELLLGANRVLMHPFVLGELALGNLRQRNLILTSLADLPQCVVARDDEVLEFISLHALFGRGIGYVDAHLLSAAALTPEARLATRDRRLRDRAQSLGLAAALAR
ncbi:type II toxin-antitoxin system VapC family toxin [Pelagibacterium halotolerans]|uniref:Ribonuclease VapC n=1 Tax=Pelagibacterium halotolerans (strain DSM 22347 / JCM 15775 / CGMCC 1.7692 / B2) TaxID=1082931 RepID=G4REA2_PELHB|nr:PIN domain-containing protein [Pelagibacterium halotolerans]AEQ51866.1 PIN domain protein [Pelagibacterium halotolerans B2]QJR18329.1 PIN domain-containing protein [Pelagibacterium halotolerans]SEA25508.1 hypothetical protein SAMN05428936_102490 [Pelagibacterium halotolerans]